MTAPTPATPAELLASLTAELPTALPTTMTAFGPVPTAGNDLFEAYIFGLVLRAARLEAYRMVFDTVTGPASSFHLRRSPGRLPSPGPSGARFTYAVLTAQGCDPLEVHTGVMVTGKSKVAHEADVLIVPQRVADRCRALDIDPSSRDAELVVEAKFYTNNLRLALGREFLGLSSDLTSKTKIFVSTTSSTSLRNLFSGRKVLNDDGVLPRRRGEASLQALLQRVLRDYRRRL